MFCVKVKIEKKRVKNVRYLSNIMLTDFQLFLKLKHVEILPISLELHYPSNTRC